jgi:hypothetical protein
LATLFCSSDTSKDCFVIEEKTKLKRQCIFPVIIGDYKFDGCMMDNPNPKIGKPWCSTRVDGNGNHISGEKNWGECDKSCKIDEYGIHVDVLGILKVFCY